MHFEFSGGRIAHYKRDLLRILQVKYKNVYFSRNISLSCFVLITTSALIFCYFEQFIVNFFILNIEYFKVNLGFISFINNNFDHISSASI